MLGGYVTFWLFTLLGLDPFVSLLLVIPLLFVLGLVLYCGPVRLRRPADEETRIKNSLLICFGLALVLQARRAASGRPTSARSPRPTAARCSSVGGRSPSRWSGWSAWPSPSRSSSGLHLLLPAGPSARPSAPPPRTGRRPARRHRRPAHLPDRFALGTALAGVAGTLVSVGYSIAPSIGLAWTLKALVVVVLAGLGSIFGTFAAGLLLGVAEAAERRRFGGPYREVVGPGPVRAGAGAAAAGPVRPMRRR